MGLPSGLNYSHLILMVPVSLVGGGAKPIYIRLTSGGIGSWANDEISLHPSTTSSHGDNGHVLHNIIEKFVPTTAPKATSP